MMTPRLSPALFDDGTVGLRIVAAMSGDCMKPVRTVKKSDPIPIRGRVGPMVMIKDDEAELSESYTCVISRLGGGAVEKRVYVNDDDDDDHDEEDESGIGGKFEMNSGVFSVSLQVVGPGPGDFLSCCFLCRKNLHDLDIFMYRGEAFCSVECRCQQIMIDENREKYKSKTGRSRESPISYFTFLPFDAGVAAA